MYIICWFPTAVNVNDFIPQCNCHVCIDIPRKGIPRYCKNHNNYLGKTSIGFDITKHTDSSPKVLFLRKETTHRKCPTLYSAYRSYFSFLTTTPFPSFSKVFSVSLTHWGRVTQICVNNITIIGSDNDLSPGRRQAIIWTNAGILLIWSLRTNVNDIFIEIHAFSFKKIYSKMSSGKWQPFCLGLNVLSALSWLHFLPSYQPNAVLCCYRARVLIYGYAYRYCCMIKC